MSPAHVKQALDLILPTNLPTTIALNPQEAETMRALLERFLAALNGSNPVADICALLHVLQNNQAAETAGFSAVKISARKHEVEDFDRYFNVRRVNPAQPAAVMLLGLVQTAAAVLDLAGRSPQMSHKLIAHQVNGFAAHARLIGRICGIGDLS